jgi:hypothetical protein
MHFTLTPPTTAPVPAPATSDKKGNRQKGNKKDKKGQTPPKEKTETPNNTLPRTSLSRPSKLHFYCHFHGWVTTHGWPSGNYGNKCQFMTSRPSEFTPTMLAACTPDAVRNHPGSTNVQRLNAPTPPQCLPYNSTPLVVWPSPLIPFPQPITSVTRPPPTHLTPRFATSSLTPPMKEDGPSPPPPPCSSQLIRISPHLFPPPSH